MSSLVAVAGPVSEPVIYSVAPEVAAVIRHATREYRNVHSSSVYWAGQMFYS